ncbi:MAG: hypothetical protein WAN43_00645 [Rhodomicrobium sp.]
MSGKPLEKDPYLRLLWERGEIIRKLKEVDDGALEELLLSRLEAIESELARTAPTTWKGRAAAVAFLEHELEINYLRGRNGFEHRQCRSLLTAIREALPAAPDWLRKDIDDLQDHKGWFEELNSTA